MRDPTVRSARSDACRPRRARSRRLAPGAAAAPRPRARGRAAALRAAGRPASTTRSTTRAARTRAYVDELRGVAQARALPRHESRGRSAWRRPACPSATSRLVRDWLGIEAPVGSPPQRAPEAPGRGLRLPPQRGERRAPLGRGRGALRRAPSASSPSTSSRTTARCSSSRRAGATARPTSCPRREREPLFAACDRHLRRLVDALAPEWVMGIGAFAERARASLRSARRRADRAHHPPEPRQSARAARLGRLGARASSPRWACAGHEPR